MSSRVNQGSGSGFSYGNVHFRGEVRVNGTECSSVDELREAGGIFEGTTYIIPAGSQPPQNLPQNARVIQTLWPASSSEASGSMSERSATSLRSEEAGRMTAAAARSGIVPLHTKFLELLNPLVQQVKRERNAVAEIKINPDSLEKTDGYYSALTIRVFHRQCHVESEGNQIDISDPIIVSGFGASSVTNGTVDYSVIEDSSRITVEVSFVLGSCDEDRSRAIKAAIQSICTTDNLGFAWGNVSGLR